MEASLKTVQEQLTLTSSELDKQKVLNEKLENDLLAMNKHSKTNGTVGNADGSGVLTPADSQIDVLAGLDLGKKPTSVGVLFS